VSGSESAVGRLLAERFAEHPGDFDLDMLPAARADASKL
jgi:hypothetical protein